MTIAGRRCALLAASLLLGACAGSTPGLVTPPSRATVAAARTSRAAPSAGSRRPARRRQRLVRWHGPVEHLFFHTLVIHPRLAFRHDALGQGFRDYFVTVREFRAILAQLYERRWTLVSLRRAIAGRVRVPRGRRPFVLSEDDVNYYDYARGRGLGTRLVLDRIGQVKVEERGPHGPRVTGEDLVPIIDAFVARHPDFSAAGAKGVLALTGYEGLLGERVNDRRAPGWAARVARARAVAARLRATGWTFANHSYGHIDVTRRSAAQVRADSLRWIAEAVPIIGRTHVFAYPVGAQPAPGSPQVQALRALGFTVQCGIDVVPRLVHAAGVTFMSRRHIDGIAFADQRGALRRFFDVRVVEDRVARR